MDQPLLTSTPPGSGPPLRWRASGSTSYSVATYGSVGPGELSGLKVEFPPGTVIALPAMLLALGPDQPTNEVEIEAWDAAYRGDALMLRRWRESPSVPSGGTRQEAGPRKYRVVLSWRGGRVVR